MTTTPPTPNLSLLLAPHLRRLASDPTTSKILLQSPEIHALLEAHRRLLDIGQEVRGSIRTNEDEGSDLVSTLLAGGHEDADTVARRALAVIAHEASAGKVGGTHQSPEPADRTTIVVPGVLTYAERHLRTLLADTVTGLLPGLYAPIQAEVEAIIKEAQAAKLRPGDDDAEAALRDGREREYKLMQSLAQRYTAACAAWTALHGADGGSNEGLAKPHRTALSRIKNPHDLVFHLGVAVGGYATLDEEGAPPQRHPVPWPDINDSAAWVLWLANSDAEPWCPDVSQYAKAVKSLAQSSDEASNAADGRLEVRLRPSRERLGTRESAHQHKPGQLPDGKYVVRLESLTE